MKVSGKLAFVIVVLVASLVFIYATTSPSQRGAATSYGMGWFAFKFKNYDKAVIHFSRAFEKDTNNLMALYFKAFSKVRVGETSANPILDRQQFSSAAFDGTELINRGKKASHKNLYLFYYIKARAHQNMKEWDAAYKNIELARGIRNDDYRILVLVGRIMIGKGEFHQAVVFLEDAVRIKNVSASEAYLNLGMAYEGLRRTDKAYYYYDKCIDSWPSKELKREAIERKTNIARK